MTFVMDRNENGVVTLGDDGYTRSFGVNLLPLCNSETDILKGRVLNFVSFSEAFSLIFVAEDIVSMLKHSINFFGVELD